jgi:aspartate/methionine/tyrosine aminotransferase
MLGLVNPGDEVLYPNPGFPIYESMINFVGATPVPVKLDVNKNFKIDINEIRKNITDKTKLLIVNSPNNPCGSVLYEDDLENLAKLVVDNDLIVLSDEVYNRFLYEGEHTSIATFPNMMDRTIILDGMSKTYAMTGWRVGFAVVPDLFLEGFVRLNTNNISCAASFSQLSIISALDGSDQETKNMIEEFRQRKELIVSGLNSIKGIDCSDPQGAFYVFPSIRDTGIESSEFVDQLLPRGVACLDGESFGIYGKGCIRLSFANTKQNIEKAIVRIQDFIG